MLLWLFIFVRTLFVVLSHTDMESEKATKSDTTHGE